MQVFKSNLSLARKRVKKITQSEKIEFFRLFVFSLSFIPIFLV
ncbi:hypothetical protein [uncultured Gammaproteobacteria bacterium]|nr:hypothetical protein [uncultured Gammaproteobacteria bacterium]